MDMTQPAARAGHLVRLLLLASTLIGLAAMHSLGHDAGMPGAVHAGHTAPVLSMAAVDACAADGCAHVIAGPAGHQPAHLPGWAICMAVVSAFAVAIVLGVLLLTGTLHPRSGGRRAGQAAGARAPPARAVGLHLASMSVLRT